MKIELKAIAKLAGVNMQRAAKVVRKNPLLREEVHIQESLVNLEESLESFKAAEGTLDRYPNVRVHVLKEQRLILHHCIGSIFRMLQGEHSLPAPYTDKEIARYLTRLIRLVVGETMRSSDKIDNEVLEIVSPYLNWHQRFLIRHKRHFYLYLNLLYPVKILIRKVFPIRQLR